VGSVSYLLDQSGKLQALFADHDLMALSLMCFRRSASACASFFVFIWVVIGSLRAFRRRLRGILSQRQSHDLLLAV